MMITKCQHCSHENIEFIDRFQYRHGFINAYACKNCGNDTFEFSAPRVYYYALNGEYGSIEEIETGVAGFDLQVKAIRDKGANVYSDVAKFQYFELGMSKGRINELNKWIESELGLPDDFLNLGNDLPDDDPTTRGIGGTQ